MNRLCIIKFESAHHLVESIAQRAHHSMNWMQYKRAMARTSYCTIHSPIQIKTYLAVSILV